MSTNATAQSEVATPKRRRFQYVLGTLLVLCVILFALDISLACGLELREASAVALAVAAVNCVACLWHLVFWLMKRLSFQFNVRMLLVLILLVGIGVGCWIVVGMQRRAQRARKWKEVVEVADMIMKAGGSVEAPGEWSDGWLAYVGGVCLSGSKITDAELAHLKALAWLRELYLDNTAVTDAGLVHLKELTHLDKLILSHTKVTDAGLVHLEGLTQLRSLSLTDTKVTDVGLVHLEKLSQLQMLGLENTKVTEQGVKKLQQALTYCKINR